MKQCIKCGVVKPYNEFHKYSKSKDGRQAYCKPCVVIANTVYQAKYIRKNGMGVYGLWNKIDDCWDYIGEGNLLDREQHHKLANSNSTPQEIKLNVWFDGFDNIYEFRLLCECNTKNQCKEMETYYIAKLNPRYNRRKRQHKIEA